MVYATEHRIISAQDQKAKQKQKLNKTINEIKQMLWNKTPVIHQSIARQRRRKRERKQKEKRRRKRGRERQADRQRQRNRDREKEVEREKA